MSNLWVISCCSDSLSKELELQCNENKYDKADYYWCHIFPKQECHLQILGFLSQIFWVFPQVGRFVDDLVKIFISIQKHIKTFCHNLVYIHQLLIKFFYILLGIHISELLLFTVDCLLKLKKCILVLDCLNFWKIINPWWSSVSSFNFFDEKLLHLIQENKCQFWVVSTICDCQIDNSILCQVVELVVFDIHWALNVLSEIITSCQ